jgi:hypothetical protein
MDTDSEGVTQRPVLLSFNPPRREGRRENAEMRKFLEINDRIRRFMESFNDSSIIHWDHEPVPLTRPSATLSPSDGEREIEFWAAVPGAALRLPRADIFRPFRTLVFGSLRSHIKQPWGRFMGRSWS